VLQKHPVGILKRFVRRIIDDSFLAIVKKVPLLQETFLLHFALCFKPN